MNTIPTPRRLARAACALALVAGLAHADAPGPTPADTHSVPPFDHYQSWRDAPVDDWRAANARVHAVGGWRTYLREVQGEAGGDDAHAHHHPH